MKHLFLLPVALALSFACRKAERSTRLTPTPTAPPAPKTSRPARTSVSRSAEPSQTPVSAIGPQVYPVGGEVTEPILVFQPTPSIPETSANYRYKGIFRFEAVISSSGVVQSVRTLSRPGSSQRTLALEAAATTAIAHWRYRPATRNGLPVPVYLTVSLSFTLGKPE